MATYANFRSRKLRAVSTSLSAGSGNGQGGTFRAQVEGTDHTARPDVETQAKDTGLDPNEMQVPTSSSSTNSPEFCISDTIVMNNLGPGPADLNHRDTDLRQSALGLSLQTTLPEALAVTMIRLDDDIRNWCNDNNLNFEDSEDATSQYTKISSFVESSLSSGKMWGIIEVKYRGIKLHDASKQCKIFLLRLQDVLDMLDRDEHLRLAWFELKTYQQCVFTFLNALEAQHIILSTSLRAWLRTPSSQMSRILQERLDNVPETWTLSHLSKNDLDRLRSGGWINDSLIDFFLHNIHVPSNVVCLSPLFYKRFFDTRSGTTQTVHEMEKEIAWSKGGDVWKWKGGELENLSHTMDTILMPVNKKDDKHWILVHANLKQGIIRVLDSLEWTHGTRIWSKSSHARCILDMLFLIEQLDKHFKILKRFDLHLDEFRKVHALKVPYQQNGSDCGIYTIMFARHLMEADEVNSNTIALDDQIPDTTPNLDFFRLKFLDEVAPL